MPVVIFALNLIVNDDMRERQRDIKSATAEQCRQQSSADSRAMTQFKSQTVYPVH